MASKKQARSAKSGKKVSLAYAKANKDSTVVEKVQKRIGKVGWAVRRPRNVGGWLGGEDGMGWPATVFDTKGEAADLTQARDCSKCKVVRVKLVEVP